MTICKEIDEYIRDVREGPYRVCEEQLLLCDFVEDIFRTEDLYVDTKQLARYMGLQKHFPYKLFPWEKFCFALHNCVYTANGDLRFPTLVIIVGRGAGKNGYLSFEDFALLTPVNGIKEYHIDIFATSEDQASTTFKDVHAMLEDNEDYFKNYFYWNKEVICNLKTKSELKYHTSSPKTKDGGRPGKVDFDEYHAYETYKLIDVAKTGLGKKEHPRETIISTMGDVRDGPMDALENDCMDILHRRIPDNGMLPFICRLGENYDEEVKDEANWHKANPSLRYFKTLLTQMRKEYAEYVRDPANHSAFMTKRMNRPKGEAVYNVTEWDNLVEATKELPDLKGYGCVAGIDYAKSNDFVSAGLLFKIDEQRYWIHHTWVCKHSADLPRVKYPLEQDVSIGFVTWVEETEIDPRLVTEWIAEQAKKYIIKKIAIDNFRYALMSDALKEIGFSTENKKVKLVRPSDLMKAAVVIGYVFSKHLIAWDVSKIMRWYTWNVKAVTDAKGNVTYEKIEPKSRKTDGFHAMAGAFTLEEDIPKRTKVTGRRLGTIC